MILTFFLVVLGGFWCFLLVFGGCLRLLVGLDNFFLIFFLIVLVALDGSLAYMVVLEISFFLNWWFLMVLGGFSCSWWFLGFLVVLTFS